MRVASICGLCKCGMLLYRWYSYWSTPWILLQPGCQGKIYIHVPFFLVRHSLVLYVLSLWGKGCICVLVIVTQKEE